MNSLCKFAHYTRLTNAANRATWFVNSESILILLAFRGGNDYRVTNVLFFRSDLKFFRGDWVLSFVELVADPFLICPFLPLTVGLRREVNSVESLCCFHEPFTARVT